MDIKVSVILPIYNVEKYLKQCLNSIIHQTLNEIEIICINDGSTDSSKTIIESFSRNDKRIILVDKTNSGYGATCNSGIRLAKGEYISIIEPDDFIDYKMLEDLYNLAVKKNADIVKSSYFEYKDATEDNEESIKKINWSEQYNMPSKTFKINDCSQLIYFHPSIWSCIYKKKFLERNKITFVEEKGAGWVDNPFQIQTLCLAKRIFYTDNAYYFYRLSNPDSSSNIVNISNPFDRSDEVHNFLEKNQIINPNIFAHLYKRELSYINIILGGINTDLFDFAYRKISQMVKRFNKNIFYENEYINDYEKYVYENCKTKVKLEKLMKDIQTRTNKVEIIKVN